MFLPLLTLLVGTKIFLESKTMKNKLLLILLVVFLGCFISGNVVAQTSKATPTPTPPLNTIRIGHCALPASNGVTPSLEEVIRNERKRGLVLDVRPSAIDQATGQMQFDGKTGRVSVVHMNPFVYKYDISVAQEE